MMNINAPLPQPNISIRHLLGLVIFINALLKYKSTPDNSPPPLLNLSEQDVEQIYRATR